MQAIQFTVFGTAEPAGSKRGVIHPHTKRVMVLDANPRSRTWKDRVAEVAARTYEGPLLDCPVELSLIFYRARPRGHMGSGKNEGLVRDRAPAYPITRPDCLKLARGVEDALTGIIYRDDAAVVRMSLAKDYGAPERVEITITQMPHRTFAELAQPSLVLAA